MGQKTYRKGLILGILIGLVIPLFAAVTVIYFNVGNAGNLYRTVKLIDNKSLSGLSLKQMGEGAAKGVVAALNDPYSAYLDGEDYEDLQTTISGSYEGIGVYLVNLEDYDNTVVLSPIKGSPAYEAGVQPMDEIISINGEDVRGMESDAIVAKIKKGEETHFVIDFLRNGEQVTLEMDRTEIQIPSVEGEFLECCEGIAYIAVTNFDESTEQELMEEILSLEEKHDIYGIILDLRNNPGGIVNSAVGIANMFLSEGQNIIWVEDNKKEECTTAVNNNPYTYPLVVLVNENSASAAEILTAALQDNKRAVIVGNVTFGKGIIQSIFKGYGDTAIKITTAEYLSPDKHKIHEKGITPDVEVPLKGDDLSVVYSLDIVRDNQLKEAVSQMKKLLED